MCARAGVGQEVYSYVCPDIVKEYGKYDVEPKKWIKQYHSTHPVTKSVPPPGTSLHHVFSSITSLRP